MVFSLDVFFDFFRTALNETPSFESENDIGEEAVSELRALGPQGRVFGIGNIPDREYLESDILPIGSIWDRE